MLAKDKKTGCNPPFDSYWTLLLGLFEDFEGLRSSKEKIIKI